MKLGDRALIDPKRLPAAAPTPLAPTPLAPTPLALYRPAWTEGEREQCACGCGSTEITLWWGGMGEGWASERCVWRAGYQMGRADAGDPVGPGSL